MLSLTIQSASVENGSLNVVYARGGDSGGYGISWNAQRLGDYEITETELEQFLLRAVLTWARRRNVTPAQMIGKTITIDPTQLRNLITVV